MCLPATGVPGPLCHGRTTSQRGAEREDVRQVQRRQKGSAVHHDRWVTTIGALVALTIVTVAGVVAVRLGPTQPGAAVAALTALATVLAAIPPIIKALHGR